MQNIKQFIIDHLKNKVFEYAVISTKDIIFSQDVVNACKANYCGRYNSCWTCPPAVGKLCDLEKKYKRYKYAFVFTTLNNLEDSFDIEGMNNARAKHMKILNNLTDKIKNYDVDWLTAQSCNICEKCTYPDAPCRYPNLAKPAVEACGIDVTCLAKTCKIGYYNGENTVTYFSVVFFN